MDSQNSPRATRKLSERRMSSMGMATYVTEKETNLSIPTFFLRFNGTIATEDFIKLMNSSMIKFERFRCKVIGTTFLELNNFDCRMCTMERGVDPKKNGTEALKEFISSIMNTPMDHFKPLWEAHIVQGLDGKDTGVVFRIHHCIADGMSLGAVLLCMSDEFPAYTAAIAAANKKEKKAKDIKQIVATILTGLLLILLELVGYFFVGIKFVSTLLRNEDQTLFKGQLGNRKNVSWNATFKVSDGKLIGQCVDNKKAATINDIVLACISGGAARYMKSKGQSSDKINITCAIPVNLRKADEIITELGNKFGFLTCQLPLYNFENPLSRIKEITKRMNKAKSIPEANLMYYAGKGSIFMPKKALKEFFDLAGTKATFAISNVKGPSERVHFLGKEVIDMSGFVPPPPGLACGFAISSYGDSLAISANCDSKIVSDAGELLSFIKEEWEVLLAAAKQVPLEARVCSSPKEVRDRKTSEVHPKAEEAPYFKNK